MTFLMGIDVSTTGVKALLLDEKGELRSSATTELQLSTPRPLWSEQNPVDWWNGAITSIQLALQEAGISGDQVAAIGLTGQMHGLTMLDEKGEVLRPAILWNDQRAGAQCNEIRERIGKTRLIQITGNDALTGFTAPKILWVRDHEPEVFAKVRKILLPKDFVRFKLTGSYDTDRAGAAGTLLVDVRTRDWSSEVLDALEIPAEWLPSTHEGPEITSEICPEAAEVTGLKVGTPVVGGGGDQAAQAVGVGAVQPGIVALTLGTSGVVFASTDEPFIEPEGRLHSFCHAVPNRWHLMGVMLSAGGSLRWYRDNLASEVSYDALLAQASEITPGSEGLLFLPYLTGERTPHNDPLARGAFVGLTVRHTQPHLTRAVLEGVAFGLRDGFEMMRSAGLTQINQVRASGGGARSALWLEILANVLNVELVTVNVTEGAAYGAALLAGTGVGVWPDVDSACRATVQQANAFSPASEAVAQYEDVYICYRQLYPTLKELSQQLSNLLEHE